MIVWKELCRRVHQFVGRKMFRDELYHSTQMYIVKLCDVLQCHMNKFKFRQLIRPFRQQHLDKSRVRFCFVHSCHVIRDCLCEYRWPSRPLQKGNNKHGLFGKSGVGLIRTSQCLCQRTAVSDWKLWGAPSFNCCGALFSYWQHDALWVQEILSFEYIPHTSRILFCFH